MKNRTTPNAVYTVSNKQSNTTAQAVICSLVVTCLPRENPPRVCHVISRGQLHTGLYIGTNSNCLRAARRKAQDRELALINQRWSSNLGFRTLKTKQQWLSL